MRLNGLSGLIGGLALLALPPAAAAQGLDPMLPEHAVKPVWPHVHVIMGFPNIGFVVGERGILAVDTGLGPRNGALVAREAARLATKGQKLYLTTTHYHPEHASGQAGFPAGTTVIRPKVQQAELDTDGARIVGIFAGRNAQNKALLEGVVTGKADVLFDHDYTLDLGGVHVTLYAFGPAHTAGDEIVYVKEDSLILPGDVVENRLTPGMTCAACTPRSWIAVLDQIAALKPTRVVPDHGELGDGGLVAKERAFLMDLQTRALALKAQGKSAEEAGRTIVAEFTAKYPDWTGLGGGGLGGLAGPVQKAYAEAP
jgi:glyoxylase-like metal-dependent hydrolase (beta-lactamase superfamily II)